MVRVKICGITNFEDALYAVKYGANALGFVFAESKRQIALSTARDIIQRLPPFVVTVGVFVNAPLERVLHDSSFCHLNAVQLHGDESPDYCNKLVSDVTVIKAHRIKDERSVIDIDQYRKCVSAHLLDTYQLGEYGGTGQTFDWTVMKQLGEEFGPIILAGGLDPENVKGAIEVTRPYAVDVSSGVELSPGKKDSQKVRSFLNSVFMCK